MQEDRVEIRLDVDISDVGEGGIWLVIVTLNRRNSRYVVIARIEDT